MIETEINIFRESRIGFGATPARFAVNVFGGAQRDRRERRNGNAYLCYHLPSGLIALSMIGFLLELLYYSFPGGPVLQREFGHDPAKLVGFRILYPMQRYTEPQDEFAETIYDTSVYDA